ncbi:protein SON-like [Acropora muricata]|uniref:protein SON-like n=1 Tax=Acropora muricata TaxID=159855 RepID=UPI0034E55E4D
MSFVSDELASVLKSVYMKEEIAKEDEGNSHSNVEKKENGEVCKEKRSRKHKHKKHSSKSKSREKKKHKRRKHKSRSSSASQSRSRSRSNERENSSKRPRRRSGSQSKSGSRSPEKNDYDDVEHKKENFLEMTEKMKSKEVVEMGADTRGMVDSGYQEIAEGGATKVENQEGSDITGSSFDAGAVTVSEQKNDVKCGKLLEGDSNTSNGKTNRSSSEEKVDDEKKRRASGSRSRSRSKEKECDLKQKKCMSCSQSRTTSSDERLSRNTRKRQSRSLSRDRKAKRKSRSSSKSRSRSHSRNKSSKKRYKSRSCSKTRNRRRTISKSRSRSRSYSKSRSRSPRRRQSYSRSRRRSPISGNHRRFSPPSWKRGGGHFRQRSHSRSRRSRSRRSISRRRQSRSRSVSRRRRGSRSQSRSRRRSDSRGRQKRSRSRSLSYSRGRRRKSVSRDGKRSKTKSRSRSKSKSKEKTGLPDEVPPPAIHNVNTALVSKALNIPDKPVADNLSSQQVKVAKRAGGKTIAELTAFCKKLQEEKEADDNSNGKVDETEQEEAQPVTTHHPFLVKEKPDFTIPPVIFPVNMNKPSLPLVDSSKPLPQQFPVSCGSKHREKESGDDQVSVVADVDGSAIQTQPQPEVFAQAPVEKFDISDLVTKRMEAQRRLQAEPNDIEALLMLQEVQMKMQNWCQSNVKPGQFTGELVKNLLPKEHLQGGFQAWAKKDMFHNLTPVSGGIGMKLLQKMGWKPGQVIGKRGEGCAEPIALTVKIDRKGLSAGKEKVAKKGTTAVMDLQGKHPVSALAEYCSKRKWPLPDYSLVFDQGPAHHKQFLFKVLVNGTEFQPAVVCGNKKQAKAQAAIFALKGLGLIPEDADISAL